MIKTIYHYEGGLNTARKAKKIKKKNSNGEGSFRYIKEKGLWQLRISYHDEEERSKRRSFYGHSIEECESKRDTFLENLQKKKAGINPEATIPEILTDYYDYKLKANLIQEQGYRRSMDTIKYIEKSIIGKNPISEISKKDIQAFFLTITCYSDDTIDKIYNLTKKAFALAVEEEIVNKNLFNNSNLACPKSNKLTKEIPPLSIEEQKTLEKALLETRIPKGRNNYIAQLFIELYSGMRMGEINALTSNDIDFDNNIIRVNKTITRGIGYRTFISPVTKTSAGLREVPITDKLKPILLDAIKNMKKNKDNLLFYDHKNNKYITTQQVNSFYKRICEKYDINYNGQHALRHTYATRCVEAGVDYVVLKEWLGHSDIHITIDTYVRVQKELNNSECKKFNKFIENMHSPENDKSIQIM